MKSVTRKTHLLHFSIPFYEFQQSLPRLTDIDTTWTRKPDELLPDDSDDSYSLSDDDDSPEQPSSCSSYDVLNDAATSHSHTKTLSSSNGRSSGEYQRPASRMRKASLPFSAIDLGMASQVDLRRSKLKVLSSVAHDLDMILNQDIAEEITRAGLKLFMAISPRHWLKYAFDSGSKTPESCPVTRLNHFANRLGEWVTSLILSHEKPRSRARQIEKFVEIAHALRKMNNYSGMSAVVAGITSAAYPEDPTMDSFKKHSPDSAKLLRSWEVLLSPVSGYKAYRLALKNTSVACIPAQGVHMSDLLKSQEGNRDVHDSDPRLIHWAKFSMISRFVDTVVECQDKIRRERAYMFPTRPRVLELLLCDELMDSEVCRLKLKEFVISDANRRRVDEGSQSRFYNRDAAGRRHTAFP